MISHQRSPRLRLLALTAALLLLVAACGSDDTGPADAADENGGGTTLEITEATIPVPPTPTMAALYLHIRNGTGTDDALVGVEIDGAGGADLHRSEITDDGLSRMVDLDEVPVPAGETVVFEPGGLHVMIDDPPALEVGDTVTVTLTFRDGGEQTVDARVTEPGADDDHSDHGDHGGDGGDDEHGEHDG